MDKTMNPRVIKVEPEQNFTLLISIQYWHNLRFTQQHTGLFASDFFDGLFNLPKGARHRSDREHGLFARMPVMTDCLDVYLLFTDGGGNKTGSTRNIPGMKGDQIGENDLMCIG